MTRHSISAHEKSRILSRIFSTSMSRSSLCGHHDVWLNCAGPGALSHSFSTASENSPLLYRHFRAQRKPRLGLGAVKESSSHIFAQGRAVLEPVSRAPARKPNIFHLRMPVDQKIPVRSIFVLANARFHNRRILQRRKSPRNILSNHLCHRHRNNPGLRIRINSLPMLVKRNLQPPSLDVRHSIDQVFLKQPCRHCRWRKPCIRRRSSEEEDFLPRGKDSRAENVRENFAKPRTARKNKLPGGNPFALARCNMLHPACLSRIHCLFA